MLAKLLGRLARPAAAPAPVACPFSGRLPHDFTAPEVRMQLDQPTAGGAVVRR